MAANIDVDRFKQVSVDEALKMAVAQLNKDGKPIEKMDFVKAGEPAKDKDGQEMDTKDGLPEVTNKNSVMMLNEKRKGLVYKLINEVGEGPNKSWTMTVELDGETFEGTGRSKRHAKSECAKHALIKLYNIMVVPDEPTSEEQAAQVVQYKVTVTTGEGADNGTTAQAWIKMMSPRRKHTGRHQLKLPEGEIFTPGSVKTFTFEAHAMNAIRKIEAWIKMMSPRRKHTGRHQLKLPEGESFTPGSVKTFTFEAHAMNAIRKIEIGHDGTTESQNWYVKKVTVEMINKELSYDFTAECWINHEVAEETKMDTGEGEGAKAAAKKEKFKKWKWGESKSAKIFTVDGYVPGPPPRVKTAKEDSEEGAEERMARKRSLDAEGGGPTKKKVKQVSQTQTKNALMHLYELKPGLQFQLISQTGPVHAPTFTMSVEVNGKTFVASGSTKKGAKTATAESALNSLLNLPVASDTNVAMG